MCNMMIIQNVDSDFIINQLSNINRMPFSHLSYRWLKQQNYTYQKARCCYILTTLIYCCIFAALGTVFIILYFDKVNYLDTFNCTIC